MIKCYFVDVKDISSDLPRSNFVESDLEQLATLILATDGLIRPLVLKEIGGEKYTVIEGHREYYAALTAKQKNSSKAEMVNAFVINDNIQSSAIEQLQLLKEGRSPVILPANTSSDIDSLPETLCERLLPTLSAMIAQQIQPLVEQLAKQQKTLEALMIDRIAPPTVPVKVIKQPDLPEQQDLSPIAPTAVVKSVKVAEPKPPKPPKVEKAKPDKVPKVTTSKKAAKLPESIDPIKATNTLNLINTLDQEQLTIRMERSGLNKTATKIVSDLISSRNSQPDGRLETWEKIISLNIKGLGDATIKGIIEKLK